MAISNSTVVWGFMGALALSTGIVGSIFNFLEMDFLMLWLNVFSIIVGGTILKHLFR